MEDRNTPIERPPMLGFKQSKLNKTASRGCFISWVYKDSQKIKTSLQLYNKLPILENEKKN